MFNDNKRILLIAPTLAQTTIIRNYIAQFVLMSDKMSSMIDIALTGLDKLKSEVSKKRITFKNGCELQILSAEGTAERLMGFGGDLIILDESCLIKGEVYKTKISRMLGDNPDSILVEIGNPWDRNNQFYEHWIDPTFKTIHIGSELAISEGRMTTEFFEYQRDVELKDYPLEFAVLYEAQFPEESADALFKYAKVKVAQRELPKLPKETKVSRIISCDVADKGTDRTVIMRGFELEGEYYVEDIYSEPKSENMQVAGRIVDWYEQYGADLINIDTIGVGVGVVSRVREVLHGKSVIVRACHFGEGVGSAGKETKPYRAETLKDRYSDSRRKRFVNRKAEQYFRCADLFNEEMMTIPAHPQLIKELMAIEWEKTSSSKNKIIDPEDHSPDFADALVYFTWKTREEVYFDFARGGK